MLKSKLPCVEIPNHQSITQFVLENVEKYGENIAFVEVPTGKQITYHVLVQRIQSVGSALYRRGLRKGDVVLLFAPNCVEYPVMFHAVVGQGAIISTCNPLYTTDELIEQLQSCKATYVFTSAPYLKKVEDARQTYTHIKEVFLLEEAMGYCSFAELCSDDGTAFPQVEIYPQEDIAVLPYSSGTTGKPKGVMLTHYNLIANCCQVCSPQFGLNKQHRFLLVMPLFHIYGIFGFMLLALRTKSMTAMLPRFEFKDFLAAIQEHRPTYLHTVPPICVKLAKSPLVDGYDMSSIETIFCGAAPLSQDIVEVIHTRFPHVNNFQQGYGMTELSPVSHCTLSGVWNGASCGVLIPNTCAKIIDLSSGGMVGANQDGEICVKGPQVMKGYLGTGQAKDETIDKDGWIHTGDVGHYDDKGWFYIVDRLKELIKYNGYQVAPAEIESLLLKHPDVADAAVIGVPDVEAGELPRAYVVCKNGSNLSKEMLIRHVAEHVAPHKKLRGGVVFMEQIPRSASGKILRRVLRDQVYTQTDVTHIRGSKQ